MAFIISDFFSTEEVHFLKEKKLKRKRKTLKFESDLIELLKKNSFLFCSLDFNLIPCKTSLLALMLKYLL